MENKTRIPITKDARFWASISMTACMATWAVSVATKSFYFASYGAFFFFCFLVLLYLDSKIT